MNPREDKISIKLGVKNVSIVKSGLVFIVKFVELSEIEM